MQILKHRLGAVTVLLCAGWLVTAPCGTLSAASAQEAQAPSATTAETGALISLGRLSPDQMSADDAALVKAKQAAIATEAALFGYNFASGDWSYDQALCPDIPGYVVLHYTSHTPGGAESLFTVLVPRGEGRVQVVPVRYRNATPFQSAAAAPRTIGVFNRVVPAEIAQNAIQPEGDWLRLGMCYAIVAGAEPRVVTQPDLDPELVKAAKPTLRISVNGHDQEMIFSDRDGANQVASWSVRVDGAGRVVAASTAPYPILAPRTVPEQAPPQPREIPPAAPEKWKPVPAAPAPVEKPIPQN
jgi:hypothetical protein